MVTTIINIDAAVKAREPNEAMSKPSYLMPSTKQPYAKKNTTQEVMMPSRRLNKNLFLLNHMFDKPGVYSFGNLSDSSSLTSYKKNRVKRYLTKLIF